MLDWSWELLPAPERTVLRRLAVQADGCTLRAAETVCAGDGVPQDEVLDLLARLVDRSLVTVARTAHGPRYRLLETVAAYCLERLAEAGELPAVRRRHHRYYTELAEQAEPLLYGADQRQWLERLDAEAANLRTALDGSIREGAADRALRLVNALAWYWFLRGRLAEAGRSWRPRSRRARRRPVPSRRAGGCGLPPGRSAWARWRAGTPTPWRGRPPSSSGTRRTASRASGPGPSGSWGTRRWASATRRPPRHGSTARWPPSARSATAGAPRRA
ncbi:hypothetical protein PQR15_07345 [Streptomyces lydicus]|nr:hypothetical protein [Streptomyces lydicus]